MAKKDVNHFDSRTLYQGKPRPSRLSLKEDKSRPINRQKKVDMVNEFKNFNTPMPLPYKPAQLYSAKNDLKKEWYVYYYYLLPGSTIEYKRLRERFDINRLKTVAERTFHGQRMVLFLNEKLRTGFNPFTAVKVVAKKVEHKLLAQFFIIKSELSKTADGYAPAAFTEIYNRFEKFVAEKDLHGLKLSTFTLHHAKLYKAWMLEKNYSKKTINSTLSYSSTFWEVGLDKEWCKDNPFKIIPRVKKQVVKTGRERFEPITSNELDSIFDRLRDLNEYSFIRYLSMIFYAWCRPTEMTKLRVADIELERDVIRFKKSNTKNRHADYVQIVPPLKEVLEAMQLKQVPPNNYLFSDEFLPGERQISKHYALDRWKRLIKDKLQINKDMYALKHTGNIEYLLNNKGNVDLKWQQKQNRHSSSGMTEQYNRKLGAYFIEVDGLNYRLLTSKTDI